jgi:hypothetical protein
LLHQLSRIHLLTQSGLDVPTPSNAPCLVNWSRSSPMTCHAVKRHH